jgi:triosephosphate isomerase
MKAIVVANWKMNPPTIRDAKKLFEATRKGAEASKNISLIVAPPAVFLRELASYRGKKISFAAQNALAAPGGAFTGEMSMQHVKDARAGYVIVGHSEQRARGVTNEDTGKEVAAALSLGLTPILCIGEQKRTQGGEHFEFVRDQLRTVFVDVPPAKIKKVLIAYEPVWAIGGEKAMSPRDMHEMSIFIRKTIVDLLGEAGHGIKILYGGSANEENTKSMLEGGDVVGLLVGHVSIDAPRFLKLLATIG